MKMSVLLLLMTIGTTTFGQEMPKFSSDQEKETWIKQNPELYEKAVKEAQSNAVHTTAEPVQSKETFESENQKKEFIKNNPEAYQQMLNESKPKSRSINDLPGFPVFVDTGDKEADFIRYQQAKDKWYAENKELVEEFMRQNSQK